MRGDAVRVFHELNESTKAQQAFLNSCGDATWISDEERRAIRWLLSALIDHRRRVRVTARLWRTLNSNEPVPCGLVSETADLLDENRYFAPFIAQWRAVVIGRTRVERKNFWRSMIELAELNLDEARSAEESCATTARRMLLLDAEQPAAHLDRTSSPILGLPMRHLSLWVSAPTAGTVSASMLAANCAVPVWYSDLTGS